MKMLYLLRHAKSDWLADADDRERVLNYSGEMEAKKLGMELRKRELKFDAIYSSPARRALQTVELVRDIMSPHQAIDMVDSFYFSDYERIIDDIRKIDNSYNSVLLVGHNPTWSDLVRVLSDEHPRVCLDTCNFVALAFDSDDWAMVSDSVFRINYIINPKYM